MKIKAYRNVPAVADRMDLNRAGSARARFGWVLALAAAAVLVAGAAGAVAQEEATAVAAPAETNAAGESVTTAVESTPQAAAADSGVATPAESGGVAGEAGKTGIAGTAGAQTNGVVGTAEDGGLSLNFRNAPIDQVLNYLADAAGFIIQIDSQSLPRGVVNLRGQNLTREEVYLLVTAELSRAGYAAVRRGRTLRIIERARATTSQVPVQIGSDWQQVADTEEIVTQIIPIRFVEAQQLVTDIMPFVSPQATIIANQAGNSVIITDTSSNIRHLMQVIAAIDSSAEDVTEVRTFRLTYADPTEMATLLTSLFPDQSGSALPTRFGGGNRGRGNRGGAANLFAAFAGGGGGGNSQAERIRQRKQVIAVADPRTQSVIVTATRDLMEQIAEMVFVLDAPGKIQTAKVFQVQNADPNEVLMALQETFGAGNTRNMNRNSMNSQFRNRIQQQQNLNMQRGGGSLGRGGGQRQGGGLF